MGLNESKGNMYSWVTHTWNTVKGECPHGCIYCYMKRWGKQKPVWFDDKELKTDLGQGNFIFVGSSCDLFAEDIPNDWITKTFNHCWNHSNNKYLFQSKNPQRIWEMGELLPYGSVVCTTIETNREYPSIMQKSPKPEDRAWAMMHMGMDKYVTIEPIMDFDLAQMTDLIWMCQPKQVNIGADSGNNHLPEPSKEKLLALIDELKKFTVIDQKRNLSRLLK